MSCDRMITSPATIDGLAGVAYLGDSVVAVETDDAFGGFVLI